MVSLRESVKCLVKCTTIYYIDKRVLVENSKIQLVVYYQCCLLIGLATTRLYVIAH